MRAQMAVAVVVISLGSAPAAVAATSAPGTLTVDGQGSVMVAPDVASLSVSVTRSASTASRALSAANRRVDAIVAVVRGLGVPASGIQTESIDTSCAGVRVGRKGHRHLVRRCTASESLSVTSTASIVGRVIDAATRAGASSVNGPDFSFSDPSAGVVAAENAAITDARTQANAAAAQLGYMVTGVQSIALNPQSSVVVPGGAAAPPSLAAPPTPTSVHPGLQEVDATVAVVFTIAPVA